MDLVDWVLLIYILPMYLLTNLPWAIIHCHFHDPIPIDSFILDIHLMLIIVIVLLDIIRKNIKEILVKDS